MKLILDGFGTDHSIKVFRLITGLGVFHTGESRDYLGSIQQSEGALFTVYDGHHGWDSTQTSLEEALDRLVYLNGVLVR